MRRRRPAQRRNGRQPPAARPRRLTAYLRELGDTTGGNRIRAGLPKSWRVADKTGTGTYGRANDIAVVWPPRSAPLVPVFMSERSEREARPKEAVIAEATERVAAALT
nr:serine hydrolase [Streptomyces cyaneochromogenes]